MAGTVESVCIRSIIHESQKLHSNKTDSIVFVSGNTGMFEF